MDRANQGPHEDTYTTHHPLLPFPATLPSLTPFSRPLTPLCLCPQVTTPAGREYALPPSELSSLGLPPVPTTTEQFVARFKASGVWADTRQQLGN